MVSPFEFITSFPIVFSVSMVVIGVVWAYEQINHLNAHEQFSVWWHLTNAAFWSLGCDVFSGLFEIQLNLRTIYQVMDTNHLNPNVSKCWCLLHIHKSRCFICILSIS